MEITYRDYKKEDKEQLSKLLNDFCEYYIEIDNLGICVNEEGLLPFYFDYVTKTVLKKNKGKIVVAMDGDKMAGYVSMYTKYNEGKELLYNRKNKSGFITDLYLLKEYRGQKVGSKLLDIAEKYLKEQDCEFIRFEVLGTNKIALDFYDKKGYKPRLVNMIKKI